MKLPTMIIDPPSPYESPEALWAFLRSLRELDQEDPAVQDARLLIGRCLVVTDHFLPDEEEK